MKNKLYLFDFDGTITSRDSFVHFFIKTFELKKIFSNLFFNFYRLIYLLVSQDLVAVKEFLLSIFLKGKTRQEVQQLGNNYNQKYIGKIIRKEALDYIKKIQKEEGSDIYIVSASLNIWLAKFSKDIGVKLICTNLSYENNLFLGKFEGNNCKGVEKVNRLKKKLDLKQFSEIISFGDSSGDTEMFAISTKYFYKPFRKINYPSNNVI